MPSLEDASVGPRRRRSGVTRCVDRPRRAVKWFTRRTPFRVGRARTLDSFRSPSPQGIRSLRRARHVQQSRMIGGLEAPVKRDGATLCVADSTAATRMPDEQRTPPPETGSSRGLCGSPPPARESAGPKGRRPPFTLRRSYASYRCARGSTGGARQQPLPARQPTEPPYVDSIVPTYLRAVISLCRTAAFVANYPALDRRSAAMK